MIISAALSLLKKELQDYLAGRPNWISDNKVELANLSRLDEPGGNGDIDYSKKVLIGLVNTEKEKTLRNATTYRKVKLDGAVQYNHPFEYVNLYILCCANFDDHDKALYWLSYVFEFFQGKNQFTYSLSPYLDSFSQLSDQQKADFKMILDHYSLNFEQLNHLWGTLGGKQLPSVMYKARLLEIRPDQKLGSGTPIEQLQSTEILNDGN